MVVNVHQRALPVSPHLVGALLDDSAIPGNALWPAPEWPPLVLDRPIGVGADGGHGMVRYSCTEYVPGRRVEFTFSPGFMIQGTHALDVLAGPTEDSCVLRHIAAGSARGIGRLLWPVAVRWLHDAVLEDLLDRAAVAVGHPPARAARWTLWVRLLRKVFRRTPANRITDSARHATREAV